MYHLALLLLVASSAFACTSVPGCECELSNGEVLYHCDVGGSRFEIVALFGFYLNIGCQSGNFSSDLMPAIELSHGGAFDNIFMVTCEVPLLSHLLARVGARGVDHLILSNPKGALETRHLEGVAGIRTISIYTSFRRDMNEVFKDTVIQKLDPGVFSHLKNLTELKVIGYWIKEIKPGAFDGLTSLQFLDLSFTSLTHLSAGMLLGADTIRLENNMNELTLETQALANLQYLKNVSIKSNFLTDLPSDLFTNSSAIESVDFTDCLRHGSFPETLFRDQKNLKRLNLSKNQIWNIPKGIYGIHLKLEYLDLSNNIIYLLRDKIFANLTNLVELRLNNNRLMTLSEGAFTGLVRLQVLYLNHNYLTFVRNIKEDDRSVIEDTKLLVSKLNFNQTGIAFGCWMKSLFSLQYIDLSFNEIRKLRMKEMEFLPKNLEVDLRNNLISIIEISGNLSSTTLYLGDNPYNCDCKLYPFLDYVEKHNSPMDLTSLVCNTPLHFKSVSLRNVPLKSLSCPLSDCPSNCSCTLLPAVSSIYLDCTTAPSFYPKPKHYNMTSIKLKLRSLKNNILPILSPEVVSLNLSSLRLIKAPSLPENLKEVDLSLNQLATIPRAISSLNATLYIAGNPVQCSCENKDDIESLLKKSNGIADGRNVYCVDGEPFTSVILSNLCEVWWTATVVIFIITFVLAIAVLVIFMFIYSDEIKRYIYKQGWNLFIYEEELDGRKYDVLVSYGDEVEKFVVQKFVPELEKRGYSVSARYKDWDIGVWIPTKVAESIDESRRVVVIPTEKYLSSVVSMELKAARLAQMGQRRRRLLIVMKEETDVEPFKEFKSLKWDSSCFWKNLEKELPKRRKKSEKLGSQANLNVLMTSEGKIEFARNKTR